MSEQNNAPVETQPENTQEQENTEEVVETSEGSSEPISKQEATDVLQKAKENGATKQELKQLREVLELKVNGKVVKKEVDWNDKEALKKELQLAYAGREAMAETAELKKLFANEINRLKSDPWSVIEELGLNADELAELRIQQKIEEMSKSPEQKAREAADKEKLALQKELEEARNKLKEKEELEEKMKIEKFEAEVAQDLEHQIIAALDAHKEIAASPKIISRIANTMLWAMDEGYTDIKPEDVIPTVQKEMRAEINEILENLPEEFLEEYIGKKQIDRLRKKRLDAAKKAKQVNNISNTAAQAPVEKAPEAPREKRRLEDFMRLR